MTFYKVEKEYYVWLANALGAGSKYVIPLLSRFGDPERVYNATPDDYADIVTNDARTLEALCDKRLSEALDIDSEDPFALLCDMGMVDESISKDPDNYLKNEEAYSIISRAYLFNENDATSLNYISDSAKISSQFKYDLAGLVGEKYIDKGKNKTRFICPLQ